jgi:thiopeptide-type bacteriocin biosynthesis protein
MDAPAGTGGCGAGPPAVTVGSETVPLTDFLRQCARQVGGDEAPAPDLAEACRAFVSGGLAALRHRRGGMDWLQYDLAPAGGPGGAGGWYAALLPVVRGALAAGDVAEFFFMHKPPGVRLRWQPAPGQRAAVDGLVRGQLDAWRSGGVIRGWRPAVYEPEAHLFGGPASMRSVHRLFTADSLVWLAYHGWTGTDGPGPVWALSLSMLREVFDGLGIAGWEDLDVWDRVRWQTGRGLGPEVTGALGIDDLAAGLRAGWSDPDQIRDLLAVPIRDLLDGYRATVADETRRWLQGYFRSGTAELGPRAAMAYLIIFHWNRAALSGQRQMLLTEALAAHPAGAPS